jgi:hypothetical protein
MIIGPKRAIFFIFDRESTGAKNCLTSAGQLAQGTGIDQNRHFLWEAKG